MNKKKFINLTTSWQEIVYALSGFGPNLLMIIMGCYFSDAVDPSALELGLNASKAVQAITGTCLIVPAIFPILMAIGKAFDGIIDIPFAHLTDNLKTKWGRRRLPIAICFIPMVLSYTLCWIPLGTTEGFELANTIWIFFWSLIFFATYTMNLIAFYGSLSTVCADDKQRLRVSSYKSFFDTISYVITYALVPLILQAGIHIDKLVFLLLPLNITMLIPLFMIKEGDKFEKKAIEDGYDITPLSEEPKVGILESLKLTFVNKPFLSWTIVNCCSFFGLQMFLASMNGLILGGMNLNSGQMAILNTAAFAPVPLMLYLFNKLKAKKGMRFAYQTCLLSFSFCILTFFIGSRLIMKDNDTLKIIIGTIGGVVGSWAIGSFFMMPYMIPASISSVEEKLTGKNHSAMYFAGQAVTTSIVGAISGSLVYEYIKHLFFSPGINKIVFANDSTEALTKLGLTNIELVYNFGNTIVPFIVCLFCIIGFIFAFKMLKNYSPKEVAYALNLKEEFEKNKHKFDIEIEYPFEDESVIANSALWVLTGSIFGYIWEWNVIRVVEKLTNKKINKLLYIICFLLPPLFAVLNHKLNKELNNIIKDMNIDKKELTVLSTVSSAICLNVISLSIMQDKINAIAKINNSIILKEAQLINE